MWPVNYEDQNKFHMSIGIGLMVASFLLYTINNTLFMENISDFETKIERNNSFYFQKTYDGKYYFESKAKIISDVFGNNNNLSIVLLITGASFFMYGYIPFIKQFKNNNKKIK